MLVRPFRYGQFRRQRPRLPLGICPYFFCYSKHCLRNAVLCCASPLRCRASRRFAFAMHCFAPPCLCNAPLRFATLRVALRCAALLRLCCALPRSAEPCLCGALPCFALQCYALPLRCFATQCFALPCLCCALLCIAAPLLCETSPRHTSSLQRLYYCTSRHSNLPAPLPRHCPRPLHCP